MSTKETYLEKTKRQVFWNEASIAYLDVYKHLHPVRLAYQLPANSTFLSE
jgi:hypothetical protein